MRIGVQFPTTEIGTDIAGIRDFAQAAEDLGYDHIRILDHVLGANPQHHPEVPNFAYTHESVIHEPFTIMSFLAAITSRVELATAIIILPQRQTSLVAKQAAEVDILSDGRLRLGFGIGWNTIEYEALGQDWNSRGRRCEEQLEVLRLLWTQEVVNYTGEWHRINHAGINPLPIQRPIPVWLGAGSSRGPAPPVSVMRRIALYADGWFPLLPLGDSVKEAIEQVNCHVQDAGRDLSTLGIEVRFIIAGKKPEEWLREAHAWQELGVTHLSVYTSGAQFTSPQQHIDAMKHLKAVIGN